jgi:hypothetical protein
MGARFEDGGDSWHTEEIRLPGVEDDEPDAARRGQDAADGPPGRAAGADPVFPLADTTRAGARAVGVSRRQRRQTLTFLAFFAVILLLGLLALAAYFGKVSLPVGSGKPTPLPTCPTVAPTLQAARDTSVNVYNASSRNGLALTVARELQKRGFRVPTSPANDPQKTPMTTMAVIRHGANGELAARTVAAVVAGPVTFAQDERPGTDVDLVLGTTFALKPSAKAGASASAAVPSASPTCVPG